MAELLKVTIDLTESGLGSDRGEVEARSLTLADELRDGKLAESAKLAREEGIRQGAKSGALAFAWGLVTAEISRERLQQLVDFLGNRFYGKAVTVQYKVDGVEFSIEHRNQEDMDRALAAIERMEEIRLKVTKTIDV